MAATGLFGALLPLGAHGYSTTVNVAFIWGYPGVKEWNSAGANAFPDPVALGNDTPVAQQTGNNFTAYINPDFAQSSDYAAGTGDDCLTPLPQYELITLRKYGCRQDDNNGYYAPVYHAAPVSDAGPAAMATGVLTVTSTTLVGTLSVAGTTDEPIGATTTIITSGLRTSESPGDGLNGYNVRTADGSPFGNAWYGVSTAATLSVNLTGTFSARSWTIDGGTVTFNDPGFACQQGGFGGDERGTLCTASTTGGGFQNNGAHLSWGMDRDGAGTGMLVAAPIDLRDETGSTTIATLSGVLAHLMLDQYGNVLFLDGETRTAAGADGCTDHIRWGGDTDPGSGTVIGISCGSLASTPLMIAGVSFSTGDPDPPDPFAFADQLDVPLSTTITSGPVTLTGIDAWDPISVSGSPTSQYSINGGPFTSGSGYIADGDTVRVRHTSAASGGATTSTVVGVGGVFDTFTSTTIVDGDATPDAFSFTDQVGVARSAVIISAPVTISGINTLAAISVSGGGSSQYSINGGAFTAVAGVISDGSTVRVRHTSSAVNGTAVDTVLTVGGVSDTFTSTTLLTGDTTPDAFSFIDQAGVTPSTTITSAPVTITGLTDSSPISVSGEPTSQFSINDGPFSALARTVTDGSFVIVRHTSSAAFGTAVDTVLTVGGVADTFTSTTAIAGNATPDPFTFADQSNVVPGSIVVSSRVTINGIAVAVPISVSGSPTSQYSVNGGAYTSASGTVTNGSTVRVRHGASVNLGGVVSTVLTVGGVSDTFTTTTTNSATGASVTVIPSDPAPAVGSTFSVLVHGDSFPPNAGATLGLTWNSTVVTLTSITLAPGSPYDFVAAAPPWKLISVLAPLVGAPPSGSFDAFVINFRAVSPGDANIMLVDDQFDQCWANTATFGCVTPVAYAQANVTVAGPPPDTTPDPFQFIDQSEVPLSASITSAPVIISGINAPAAISVAGSPSSQYSINGGAFTSASGTVAAGNSVRVRHVTAASPGTSVETVLTVGGVADTFTSTTVLVPDTTPDSFSLVDQVNAPRSTVVTSAAVTVSGINTGTPISVGGHASSQYSIDNGAFTSAASTVGNGSIVRVRHISSGQFGASVDTTLTVGGVTDTFTSTTVVDATGGDQDGDGVADTIDNCILVPNADQRDTNGDGYGNVCDGDLNDSGRVTSLDFNMLRSVLNQSAESSALASAADMNGSGLVTFTDYNLLREYLNLRPGPSGLHP